SFTSTLERQPKMNHTLPTRSNLRMSLTDCMYRIISIYRMVITPGAYGRHKCIMLSSGFIGDEMRFANFDREIESTVNCNPASIPQYVLPELPHHPKLLVCGNPLARLIVYLVVDTRYLLSEA